MENKTCKRCHNDKPLSDFEDNKNNCKVCSECLKTYYKNNKLKLNTSSKLYYKENIEKSKITTKKFRETNPDKKKGYDKKYRKHNQESQKTRSKNWRELNPNYGNNYKKNRRLIDPIFKLKCNINTLINDSLRGKAIKELRSYEILRCSFSELKTHLENKFESWMNWDNHGNPKDGVYELNKTWDIDHIIPLATAITEEDVIRLNHYSNLQPLCSYINRFIKKANY